MFDPALTGYRDKVIEIERYAEMVLEDRQSTSDDRAMAEHVRRQAVGLTRMLDRWRAKPSARLRRLG
jgi:hypothetical protein